MLKNTSLKVAAMVLVIALVASQFGGTNFTYSDFDVHFSKGDSIEDAFRKSVKSPSLEDMNAVTKAFYELKDRISLEKPVEEQVGLIDIVTSLNDVIDLEEDFFKKFLKDEKLAEIAATRMRAFYVALIDGPIPLFRKTIAVFLQSDQYFASLSFSLPGLQELQSRMQSSSIGIVPMDAYNPYREQIGHCKAARNQLLYIYNTEVKGPKFDLYGSILWYRWMLLSSMLESRNRGEVVLHREMKVALEVSQAGYKDEIERHLSLALSQVSELFKTCKR